MREIHTLAHNEVNKIFVLSNRAVTLTKICTRSELTEMMPFTCNWHKC